jgi:hypothetical protein
VRRGDGPGAPDNGIRLVEPAVSRLVPRHRGLIPGPCGEPVRSPLRPCRAPGWLTAPAATWRAAAASRTHRTIVPAPTERVTRKPVLTWTCVTRIVVTKRKRDAWRGLP